MTSTRLLLAVLLASLSASVVGCTSATDGDDSSSDESDIKKKVKPKGGNGEFDLVAPTFKTDGFSGSFLFDNAAMKGGDAVQKVPGTYLLRGYSTGTADGQTPPQSLSFAITAGAVTKQQLGGVNIHFSEPLTLGSARVDLTVDGQGTGFLEGLRTWQAKPTGSSFLVLPGKLGVTPSTEDTRTDYDVAANMLKEIVLPVAHLKVALDAYDSAYPSPTTCTAPFATAGASYRYNSTQVATLRNTDGSPNGTFVIPSGGKAPVTVNAYGLVTTQPTTGGGTNAFTLNRLEVDDVEVAQSGGGSTFVKGTVTVAKKGLNGALTALNCSFPTHSGIDLPDGDYTVTSRASTASGTVTSSEDVSFP